MDGKAESYVLSESFGKYCPAGNYLQSTSNLLLMIFSLSVVHAFTPFGQPLKIYSRHGGASSRIRVTMQAAKQPVLTKDLFDKLDRDRSGTIDLSGSKKVHKAMINISVPAALAFSANKLLFSSRPTIDL